MARGLIRLKDMERKKLKIVHPLQGYTLGPHNVWLAFLQKGVLAQTLSPLKHKGRGGGGKWESQEKRGGERKSELIG